MSTSKKICVCGLSIALCLVLPPAFHALGLGALFSPMHLPVLLCGLLCGWPYGALCGAVGPVLSSLLSSMPSAAQLPYMVIELMVYGFFTGLFMKLIRTGRAVADLYLSLIPAMLLGRIAGGVARAIFYLGSAQGYSLSLWAGAYFVGTFPGIVLQLIVLPIIYLALTKARLIPARYPSPEKKTAV